MVSYQYRYSIDGVEYDPFPIYTQTAHNVAPLHRTLASGPCVTGYTIDFQCDYFKVGTTGYGSTDILNEDFSNSGLPLWASINNAGSWFSVASGEIYFNYTGSVGATPAISSVSSVYAAGTDIYYTVAVKCASPTLAQSTPPTAHCGGYVSMGLNGNDPIINFLANFRSDGIGFQLEGGASQNVTVNLNDGNWHVIGIRRTVTFPAQQLCDDIPGAFQYPNWQQVRIDSDNFHGSLPQGYISMPGQISTGSVDRLNAPYPPALFNSLGNDWVELRFLFRTNTVTGFPTTSEAAIAGLWCSDVPHTHTGISLTLFHGGLSTGDGHSRLLIESAKSLSSSPFITVLDNVYVIDPVVVNQWYDISMQIRMTSTPTADFKLIIDGTTLLNTSYSASGLAFPVSSGADNFSIWGPNKLGSPPDPVGTVYDFTGFRFSAPAPVDLTYCDLGGSAPYLPGKLGYYKNGAWHLVKEAV